MNSTDFLCAINKLKLKQICLEKENIDYMKPSHLKYDPTTEDEYKKLKKIRQNDFLSIQKYLNGLMQRKKKLKSHLTTDNLASIDVMAVKKTLIEFQKAVDIFHKQINSDLQDLRKDETQLSLEVINIELKLFDSGKYNAETKKVSLYNNTFLMNDDKLSEEVKVFSKFLNETGGHNGGWMHDDHLLFVKMFNKYKNKITLLNLLKSVFPGLEEQKILAHYDWYKKYLDLRNNQRRAIKKWRTNKNKKITNVTTSEILNQKVSQNKQKLSNDNNKNVIREKIEKWKLEKQQKFEDIKKQEEENRKKIKEQEKQKQVKQQQKKEEVEKWKNQAFKENKEDLEQKIKSFNARQKNIQIVNKLIREFQHQDSVYISKRLQSLKIDVKPPNMKRQLSCRKIYPRNPERLLKPTEQWVARTSKDAPETNNNILQKDQFVKKIPKLFVPEWRKVIDDN